MGVALASGFQPRDADLDAIAALATTSYGRGLLAKATFLDLHDAGVGPDLHHLENHSDSVHTGPSRLEIALAGTVKGTRSRLNFLSPGSVTYDDAANGKLDILNPSTYMYRPTGILAETIPRVGAGTDSATLLGTTGAGGFEYHALMYVVQGTVFSNLNFELGATAQVQGGAGTFNTILGFRDLSNNLLACSANTTSINAASSALSKAVASIAPFTTNSSDGTAAGSYTVATSGFYYITCMIYNGTGGAPVMPSALCTVISAQLAGKAPILSWRTASGNTSSIPKVSVNPGAGVANYAYGYLT